MVGDAEDARDTGVPLDQSRVRRTERHEAGTRFFMTPGSEQLRREATSMMKARRITIENSHADDEEWERNFSAYRAALFEIEAAVRTIVARGRI